MDIIAAYREAGTYRGAAQIAGTTHKTVRRVIARQEAGGAAPARVPRGLNYDGVAALVAGRVAKTLGRISAKRLLPAARAAGYAGSDRNFRRLVAEQKALWRREHHRGRRPAVWSPGERPKARQIRDIDDCDRPVSPAIDRVDQCVSCPRPFSVRTRVTTTSTCSSVIFRGVPGRDASASPSSRRSANRTRHLRAISRDTPTRAATAVSGTVPDPSTQASTIRARSARDCNAVRLRTSASRANATGFRHLGVSAGFRGLVTAGSFWLPAWRVRGPALFHSWSGGAVGHGDDGGGNAGDGVLRGGVAEAAG